jgi:hypothetical protein
MKKGSTWIIIGIVVIIMILTNPSKDDFTDYCTEHTGGAGTIGWVRKNIGRKNYLIYSIHKAQLNSGGMTFSVDKTETYIGIFGTFLKDD